MNVKSVIENVKEVTGNAAQTAATKSKQVYAIAKARIGITTETDKIRRGYLELGKLYYKDYAAGAAPEAETYQPWCDKITESKVTIEALREQIETLKAELKKKGEPVDEEEIDVEIFEQPVEIGESEEAPETPETPEAPETPETSEPAEEPQE